MRILKTAIVLLLAFSLFLGNSFSVFAQSGDEKLQDLQKQINDLQRQLDEARGQEKTLKSQLEFIDTQTKLTQAKVDQTNFQITKLEKEISDLSTRITKLSATVDNITQILLARIIQTYKYSNFSSLDLLFSSHGFADLLERIKYIQVVQANDKKVLYQLQATKAAYNDQKNDKETRQTQQEKLKKDLEQYQNQLAEEKKAKDELLKVTQNNEAVYQAKLQAALSEQQAILAILSGGGTEVAVGPVHKGDVIGYAISGASTCSSGTHLHFEVHQNGQLVNPATLLSDKSVTWDNSPDGSFSFTGSWDWPISDPVYIEQGFGATYWAKLGWYSTPPGHTGIDIYSPSSLAIRAIHDGTLSNGGIGCRGGTLRYKKVDHGDGTSSYYLHVS